MQANKFVFGSKMHFPQMGGILPHCGKLIGTSEQLWMQHRSVPSLKPGCCTFKWWRLRQGVPSGLEVPPQAAPPPRRVTGAAAAILPPLIRGHPTHPRLLTMRLALSAPPPSGGPLSDALCCAAQPQPSRGGSPRLASPRSAPRRKDAEWRVRCARLRRRWCFLQRDLGAKA